QADPARRSRQPEEGHARARRQVAEHRAARRGSRGRDSRDGERDLLQPRPVLLRGLAPVRPRAPVRRRCLGRRGHRRTDPRRPGARPQTEMGPLVSEEQLRRVTGFMAEGKRDGAHAVAGGERRGDAGYFVAPTVFVGTTPEMSVQREEIFGPVVTAIPYRDESDLAAVANDNRSGLAAGLWTNRL